MDYIVSSISSGLVDAHIIHNNTYMIDHRYATTVMNVGWRFLVVDDGDLRREVGRVEQYFI